MKKFKAESQRVLDMMINSIYTHKEIFIRELLSNASDAIDKLYYKSLTENLGLSKEDFAIKLSVDKTARTMTIEDNGIGMDENELDNNLGVIAKSGSDDFKKAVENKPDEDINIIGQFGVGFYSAFMVASRVTVLSKKYGSDKAYQWESNGSDGYTVKEAEKIGNGSIITLYLKDNADEEKYDDFLEEYKIRELVKRYSDYIKYPIQMECEHTHHAEKEGEKDTVHVETETLNSMIPLWKKNKNDIKEEDYNEFYKAHFYDYENPLKTVHFSVEGAVDYKALLFIPSRAPYNYYSKDYEKGLKLYTNGVLITERCADLLPDYFSFVRGLVDSELTLNVSRETVQHNVQLKRIAQNLEKKIKNELLSMLDGDRKNYEKFFKEFGFQLKYGLYSDWGAHKDELKDLILFYSVKEDKNVTLKEYADKMLDSQKYIYYASGKSVDAIKLLPQTERVRDMDYDVLCLTQDVDEFAIKFLMQYNEKEFKSVSDSDLGLTEAVEETEKDKDLIAAVKDALGDKVDKVKLSSSLKNHPVCLSSEGEISIEMEKILNSMPNENAHGTKATKVLELSTTHPIYGKLLSLLDDDKAAIADYAAILFAQAQLIGGITVENPASVSDLICKLLAK